MPEKPTKEPAQAAVESELTLDEFCTRLSTRSKRVELISAFHHHAKSGGLLKSTESVFAAAFADYTAKPI